MLKKICMISGLMLLLLGCRSQVLQIDVHFDRLYGLAPGDRVLFEANTAGRVDAIQLKADGSYTVRLQIDKGFAYAATEYTHFKVVNDGARTGYKAIAMSLSRRDGTPLPDGASVRGEAPDGSLGHQLNRELEEGFAFFKKQMEKFSEDLKQIPQSEAYRKLKQSLSDLAEDIGRSEQEARQRLKEEWLPQIERELENLKRRLGEDGREDATEPLQQEIDRNRKI